MPTTANTSFTLPVSSLKGVGKQIANQLADAGIHRLLDLLLHLPRGYEDHSRVVAIDQVVNGQSVLIEGHVRRVSSSGRGGMSVTVEDETGSIVLRFFNTYQKLQETMKVNAYLRLFGEVKINNYGVQLHHPEFEVITPDTPLDSTGLVPIYRPIKSLHQNKVRTLILLALQTLQNDKALVTADILQKDDWETLGKTCLETLSNETINNLAQLNLFEALTLLHTPPLHTNMAIQLQMLAQIKERHHPACQRIIIEELSAHQLSLLYRRQQLQQQKSPRCEADSPLAQKLLASLPFILTDAQQRVIEEIHHDLIGNSPMLRLVQGDVGAGKTLVAAVSACYALDSGWQVAIMAPTEILAEQHFNNFKAWFEPLGVGVGWLVGKQKVAERRKSLQDIVENEVQIVIGTHALFQEKVRFAKLGLVVIDEQHRFGVEQRTALTDKGIANTTPHQLVMTATPIPRTLAMSAYGDMDSSIIDELPPNRTPVTTVMVNRKRRDEVLQRIEVNCQQGKQAYWICSLVEESSELDAQSAQATYEDVSKRLNIRIGLVHGKMKASEKQSVMQAFKEGNLDMLIATTVIEVGVDIANASLMVIENAERLGLSQLHQLRGRVGRGSEKSFCVLLYQMPLSDIGIERLNILTDTSDGFVIAEKDLQLRGAGELLGKRQAGTISYYLADIERDQPLVIDARILAEQLINDPKKQTEVKQLITRWIPDAERFIKS